jgi:hypothetical protein
MKKTKAQKKREKKIKEKQRLKALEASENKFFIKIVNGIEIAYSKRISEDIVTEKSIQQTEHLSKIAIDKFNGEGRGSFLIVSEANPNEAVYLRSKKLFESIKNLIPEALHYVRKVVDEYDPHGEFLVINVFSDKRIAISRDALRL